MVMAGRNTEEERLANEETEKEEAGKDESR